MCEKKGKCGRCMDDMFRQGWLFGWSWYFDTLPQESNFPGIPCSDIQVSTFHDVQEEFSVTNPTSYGIIIFFSAMVRSWLFLLLQRRSWSGCAIHWNSSMDQVHGIQDHRGMEVLVIEWTSCWVISDAPHGFSLRSSHYYLQQRCSEQIDINIYLFWITPPRIKWSRT